MKYIYNNYYAAVMSCRLVKASACHFQCLTCVAHSRNCRSCSSISWLVCTVWYFPSIRSPAGDTRCPSVILEGAEVSCSGSLDFSVVLETLTSDVTRLRKCLVFNGDVGLSCNHDGSSSLFNMHENSVSVQPANRI